MKPTLPELPIDAYTAEIIAELQKCSCLIIEAPPGTGKTTRAAPALLPLVSSLNPHGRILLVQPRRIAARAAAARIALELGCPVGQLVGYQVRFDARTSAATRLIAMTPGILLRQLQGDAVLSEVAAVVLDEFHERSLEMDLLLGMLRRVQAELRPELRLVVMSATLDRNSIADYLEHPPRICVTAQTYPVQTIYGRYQATSVGGGRPAHPSRRIVEQTIAAVRTAASSHQGDMLVFLPGVGEINQVARELQFDAERQAWQLMKLYGDMTADEQDRVLAPSQYRKVILSTNLAETSLTIDQVRVVVDSGWARVQRNDPALGLNMLMLEPISQASANQRRGRAGRTAPGVCYRLWDEITGRARAEHLEPEVLRVDLSGAVLQLTCWGETDIEAFPWLSPPPTEGLQQARQTLELLGATAAGRVTELGRRMNHFPLHPRLAKLLIAGEELGIQRVAALAAACLSERQVFEREPAAGVNSATRYAGESQCDVMRQVLALLRFEGRRQIEHDQRILKIGAAQHVLRVAEQLQRMTESAPRQPRDTQKQTQGGAAQRLTDDECERRLGQALLAAFPDRLAKRRGPAQPRGLMVGGRGVKVDEQSSVGKAELFLCLDVDGAGSEARVRQASAVDPNWLPAALRSERDERFFNPTTESVVTRRRQYFLDLLLSETPIETPADELTAQFLARAAAERFQKLLPPKDKVLHCWLARVQWLSRELPEAPLPQLSIEGLTESIGQWCTGLRKIDELKQLPWLALLTGQLTPEGRRLLDTQAPEQLRLPTGRSVLLQYEVGKPPILAARIQEFFGWKETPRLASGRIPLLVHLLAPNGRVQQITDDLASFWKNTYPVVRKELRGRYPKHAWPEDPIRGE